MINCYFTNLQNITTQELMNANCSIKAAVAWINFKYYTPVFMNLLDKGVKIKILLNDDNNNRKNMGYINQLCNRGAKIRLVRYSGIMHHKFCVVDKQKCLFGSFNWTDNANLRNIEDLNICDDLSLIYNYLLEFKALWELSKSDIRLLRNPQKCDRCGTPLINIMLMDQEDNQTKVEIIQQCNCGQKDIFTDYFDIRVYNNYLGIIDQLNDEIAFAEQSKDIMLYNQLTSQQDFVLSSYLSTVRKNRMGCPIIHAVGVKHWKWIDKHDGYWCYQIIWKERNTESYVEDEYNPHYS